MKTVVTGASGFVGRHVARALAEAGAEVLSVGRSAPPAEARVCGHVTADVRDPAALERAVRGCAAVVHVAAHYSYDRADAAAMEEVNVAGTANVLAAAARAGVGRVVVTSSSATCGPVRGRSATEADAPPAWELVVPYKRTKLAAERLALAAAADGLEVVVVNPTSVVGPGDRRPTPTGRMIAGVASGRIRGITRGGGLNVVAVEDVARGHVLALEHGRRGERYLLAGEDLTLAEVFATIARRAGRTPPRVPVPWTAALAAAHVAQRAGRVTGRAPRLLVLDEVRLARLPLWFTADKARRELGWSTRPAREALHGAVDWMRAEGLLA